MFKFCSHEYVLIDKHNTIFSYQPNKRIIVYWCWICGKIKKKKVKLV